MGATPFLTLAFLAVSVIPSLKLTDRGLVDVDRFEIEALAAEQPAGLSRSQRARYRRPCCFAIAPASRSPVMNMCAYACR